MKQKKIKILFRTYGGKVKNRQTGLGHIFRSINLSYYLKHSVDLHFLVEDYGGAKKIFNEYGFTQISSLAKNCGYLTLNDTYKCNYYKPLISQNLIN